MASELDFEEVVVEFNDVEANFDDIYIDGEKMSEKGTDLEGGTQTTPSGCAALPHPISVFFHVFFKLTALFIYLIVAMVVDNFTLVFILVLLCLAADFWTVKNVTGRLLVGMRYWNEIKEDGSNEWFFESLKGKRKLSKIEAAVFWVGLLGFPIVWLLLGILAIFELDPLYLILIIIAFVLSCPNIYGYLRCAKEAHFSFAKAKGFVEDKAKDAMQEAATAAVKEKMSSAFSFGKK